MGKEDTIQSEHRKNVPSWLKVVISLAVLGAIAVCLAIFFTQDLVKTADGQLDALRSRDFTRAYYEYTAKDFKAATSLEGFQEFVKAHPALLYNDSASFNERSIENNVGTLHGTLMSKEGGVTPIEYKFVKEGDRWKILSMRLIPTGAVTSGAEAGRNNDLVEAVEAQLAAFRSNDVAKAYFGYVSRDFQETTPLKAFKEFVRNYPILTRHNSATFGDAQLDGKQGTIDAVLHGDSNSHSVEYKLVREDGRWKIWSLRLNLPTDATARQADPAEIDDITDPIEAILAYLRAGDFARAYYEYAAKEFQSATSLEAFREFVKAYPALTEHSSVTFEEPTVQEDAATVVATLTSANGTIPVEYQLIKNGRGWKVWSMQILSRGGNKGGNAPAFNTADLVNTIESQLSALRQGDVSKAYYAFTSRDFQKSTSPGAFEKFVQSHDALNRNKVANFSNLSFNNDVGTFQGLLTADNRDTSRVEYDLIYEDGRWRILSIQLLPDENSQGGFDETVDEIAMNDSPQKSSTRPRGASMDIARIVVGSELDREGRVRTPRTRFHKEQSDINVDLYVSNAKSGDQAELILEHIESKTRVPAVETRIDDAGDTILSYIFTPPTHGWPRGNYRLIGRTSNGKEKVHEFRVD